MLQVFSDRDITSRRDAVARALDGADVFFGSLLFDFDQVGWWCGGRGMRRHTCGGIWAALQPQFV